MMDDASDAVNSEHLTMVVSTTHSNEGVALALMNELSICSSHSDIDVFR
jgi:hypothetical protein